MNSSIVIGLAIPIGIIAIVWLAYTMITKPQAKLQQLSMCAGMVAWGALVDVTALVLGERHQIIVASICFFFAGGSILFGIFVAMKVFKKELGNFTAVIMSIGFGIVLSLYHFLRMTYR